MHTDTMTPRIPDTTAVEMDILRLGGPYLNLPTSFQRLMNSFWREVSIFQSFDNIMSTLMGNFSQPYTF